MKQLGGVVVSYGMTLSPKMDWSMAAVLKNIELRGSTMGSREEFREMVKFVGEKKIIPVVSRIVKGLDNLKDIDGLFEDMRIGSQFGKLVVEVVPGSNSSKL
jgi:D-arabinose 1-dehydrogenase-like Zn-dependent alcohol dehydrogenase